MTALFILLLIFARSAIVLLGFILAMLGLFVVVALILLALAVEDAIGAIRKKANELMVWARSKIS